MHNQLWNWRNSRLNIPLKLHLECPITIIFLHVGGNANTVIINEDDDVTEERRKAAQEGSSKVSLERTCVYITSLKCSLEDLIILHQILPCIKKKNKIIMFTVY